MCKKMGGGCSRKKNRNKEESLPNLKSRKRGASSLKFDRDVMSQSRRLKRVPMLEMARGKRKTVGLCRSCIERQSASREQKKLRQVLVVSVYGGPKLNKVIKDKIALLYPNSRCEGKVSIWILSPNKNPHPKNRN